VTAVSSSLGDGEYVELVVLGWNVVVVMLLLEIGLVVEEYMDVDVAAVWSLLGDGEDVYLVELVVLVVEDGGGGAFL